MARAHANPPLAKRLTAKGFLAQNHATFLILLIDQLVLTRENNSLIFLTTDSVCAGLMPYRVNRVLPQASTRSTVITLVIWLSVSPNYCWDVKTLDCMQTAHIFFLAPAIKVRSTRDLKVWIERGRKGNETGAEDPANSLLTPPARRDSLLPPWISRARKHFFCSL